MGVPKVRRLKTYSALSGHVYQYVYVGYRDEHSEGRDYVFQVSGQREAGAEVPMRIPATVIASLELHAARSVDAREQYALAKMMLFRFLDEWAEISTERDASDQGSQSPRNHLCVLREEDALDFWETLDL